MQQLINTALSSDTINDFKPFRWLTKMSTVCNKYISCNLLIAFKGKMSVEVVSKKSLSTYISSIVRQWKYISVFVLGVAGFGIYFGLNALQSQDLNTRSEAATAISGCWPTNPLAGALPGQPLAIWCYSDLGDGPSTAIKGNNTWVDEFNHGLTLSKFDTQNYTDFPITGSLYKSQLWRHGNHWMRDMAGSGPGGEGDQGWNFGLAAMRPNATFKAENGQLTIEAEVATRISDYGGNLFWPEFVITTADRPTQIRSNGTYVYEAFPNHWTFGCRLQNDGGFTCAILDNSDGGDSTARVTELSHFQCGNSPGAPYSTNYQCHSIYGGLPSNLPADSAAYSRDCQAADPDTNCRDRWRWEITENRSTWFVNGVKYMEHTNFDPGARTVIRNLINQPVYVYFGEFLYKLDKPARMHWDRIAINPKDASGNLLPPSAVPGFCLPWPQCLGLSITPTPLIPTPTSGGSLPATPTPTLTPTPTVRLATPTPTTVVNPTPIPTLAPSGDILGNQNIGKGTDDNNSNYLNGSRFVTGGAAKTVNSMAVHVGNVAAAPNNQFQVAIYSDLNGRPGSLISKSASGALMPNIWNFIAISAQLQPNTPYWLMYNTNGTNTTVNNMHYDSSTYGTQAWSTQGVPFGGWPTVFPQSTLGSHKFSIYAFLSDSTSNHGNTEGTGLLATYFDNADLTGLVMPRLDSVINFNWGNKSPFSQIGNDTFSARWTGFISINKTEKYTFYARSDDGVRVWVDNKLIIDNWRRQAATEKSGSINLEAGKQYPIKVEYYENTGNAVMQLRYSSPSMTKRIIPMKVLFPDSHASMH